MRLFAFIWPTLALLNDRIFAGVRLSVLPILGALGVWMVGRLYAGLFEGRGLETLGFVMLELLALCFCHAWFAIRWLRLILKGEPQTAIGGDFPPRAWRRYALRLFGLALAFWLTAEGVIWASDRLWAPGNVGEWLRYISLYIALGWLFFRISPVLVGAPLGDPLSRRQAWDATRGTNLPCLGLAIGTLLLSSLLKFPMTPDGGEISAFEPLYIVAAFWLQVLAFTGAITVVYRDTVMRSDLRQ